VETGQLDDQGARSGDEHGLWHRNFSFDHPERAGLSVWPDPMHPAVPGGARSGGRLAGQGDLTDAPHGMLSQQGQED
jgi:hypothetical protein